jgi:hypothetical protein
MQNQRRPEEQLPQDYCVFILDNYARVNARYTGLPRMILGWEEDESTIP